MKLAIGAVFHISKVNAEIILGLPPMQVTNTVFTVKHYLKILLKPAQLYKDPMLQFIENTLAEGQNIQLNLHMKMVYRFLEWKCAHYPFLLSSEVISSIKNRDISNVHELSPQAVIYTKQMMHSYTEELWKNLARSRLQLEGVITYPVVSVSGLPMPYNAKREEEVLIMSFMYNNNILNKSLFRLGHVKTPLCACKMEEQTAIHLLTRCSLIPMDLREGLSSIIIKNNNLQGMDSIYDDAMLVLNCRSETAFLDMCHKVVKGSFVKLCRKIILT